MVETFNDYQARIRDLLERERAFNRYTSHELRTPLMVMKGAITLLGESKDEAFIEKQRQRLEKATGEIGEFIETLLTLTKAVEGAELIPRALSEEELTNIVANHQHLLNNKAVEWWVKVEGDPVIRMPEAAFHILLGNVIKNAFACVERGVVSVVVNSEGIQVCDTGPGLYGKSSASEGFGLGLLLVRDICHRYGWSFELKDNSASGSSGCTAVIGFAVAQNTGEEVKG
nr:HAMP domain-containing sensor histidine kinase [Aliamphritea spongicola]